MKLPRCLATPRSPLATGQAVQDCTFKRCSTPTRSGRIILFRCASFFLNGAYIMASTETFAQFDEYQQRSPEFQLWCAVLFRLIEDLQKGKNKATRYLWSDDFTWLCTLLGFDAVDVRQRLAAHTGISTKFKHHKKANDPVYQREYMKRWREKQKAARLGSTVPFSVPTMSPEQNGVNDHAA